MIAPHATTSARPVVPPFGGLSAARCPFHDGVETLDLLLAELDPRDLALFDAVLDLRSLCVAGEDAAACVEQLFRVRTLLGERHYLAFFRVRCWAHRALRIEVRGGRGSPWLPCALPLNGARCDEIVNAALAPLAADGVIPAAAHVRFAFAPASLRKARQETGDSLAR